MSCLSEKLLVEIGGMRDCLHSLGWFIFVNLDGTRSSLERLARCVQRVLHHVLHIQAIDIGQVVPQVSGVGISVQDNLRGKLIR